MALQTEPDKPQWQTIKETVHRMPNLHVVFTKESLDPSCLAGKVAIVLDVLFATSTIVHAFGEGVECVWPARDADDARRIATDQDASLSAGEYLAKDLPGFGPATPLALCAQGVKGARLVYATTNGTVALNTAATAAHVYVGALTNGKALAARVACAHPDAPVVLVCSGSMGMFNLEDFYGAGHIASHLEAHGQYTLTDAARAALLLTRSNDSATVLGQSRIGRLMRERNLQHEVDHAARLDISDTVPVLDKESLRVVAA